MEEARRVWLELKEINPKYSFDEHVEALLATQMAGVHLAAMTSARYVALAENIPQRDSAECAFNKLTRTFAMQMEALKRYWSSGQQKVTVEHVTVNKGGQAIVGNVQQAAPQQQPAEVQTPPALSDQSGTTLEMKANPAPVRDRLKRR